MRPPRQAVASWTLRPATAADLERARRLVAACDLPLFGVEEQFGDQYVLAERSGRLIGVAGLEIHGRFGLLRSVAVVPGARGGGVGADLVRDRLAWARNRGLAAVYLLTTTAEEFFARRAFVAVDRAAAPVEIRTSNEFAQACPESARLMSYALAAGR